MHLDVNTMSFFGPVRRKYTISLLLLLVASFSYGQETMVTYIKKNGGFTVHKDSAEYKRIVRILPNAEGLYELNEYYNNGNLKRHGWIKDINPHPLRFEGVVESYFDNGSLEETVRYGDGQQIDTAERYYRNGILKEREAYLLGKKEQSSTLIPDEYKRLVYYADSLGNVQVEDGNGHAEIVYNEKDVERGLYAEGLRVGRWEGTFRKGKYRFEEWYEEGKVSRGLSVDSLGRQYPYEERDVSPEYSGGVNGFRKFIGQNFQYPRKAIQAKVQGIVVIAFVVDTLGTPMDFEVLSDLGYGTVRAGIDVIKKSGLWIPGQQRGVPARVKYTLPIRLNLSSQAPPNPSSP